MVTAIDAARAADGLRRDHGDCVLRRGAVGETRGRWALDGDGVDRKEKLVAIAMTQTSNREFLSDFENMVMQAVVDQERPLGRAFARRRRLGRLRLPRPQAGQYREKKA